MKGLYNYLLPILAICCSLTAFSQTRTVSGMVSDSDGEGLPGATVLEKGTSNGTVTDIDGAYTLKVSDNSTLTFSYIGFEVQEVEVGNESTIDVALSENLEELAEVVVIGYGTQKKRVVTGAIESISAEEINAVSVVRIDQALQGRAAGVQVLNQSGQPGERPSIRIRGIGTDGDSDPLFLVDGIPVLNIDNLNPADIKSLDVLKDAASTSIYGARAANGVVLITTKTGSNKGKPGITYNGYVGFQNARKKLDLLNAEEYVEVMNMAGATALDGSPFDPNEIQTVDTDWQDEIFSQNAQIHSHYVGLDGGNDKSSYTASISYFDQQGIVGGDLSKFERYTARLSSRSKINNVINWGQTLNYSQQIRRGVDSNSSFNGELGSALNIDPLTAVYEDNESILGQLPYSTEPVVTDADGRVFAISNNVAGEVVNPLARLQLRTEERTEDQVQGNIFLELEPIENLKFKTTGSIDLIYRNWDSYTPLYYLTETINNIAQTGVSRSSQKQTRLQWENTLNYTKKFGKHNVNLLVGTTDIDEKSTFFSAGGVGVNTSNPNLIYLDLGVDSLASSGGDETPYTLASVFSRVLYDYNDRLSFSTSFRRDGSSRFGPQNKFASFYSFGVSWVISDEAFFPKWDKLSYLKLRSSWGQNGNDRIDDFRYNSLVDFNIAYNQNQGAIQAIFADEGIKWETSTQLDLAIDAGLFDDRLTLTFDYYKKVTDDLLQPLTVLATVGFEAGPSNVGSVENEGFEWSARWRDRIGDVGYSISANASFNKNTMTRVASEAGFIEGNSWALAGEVTRIIEGQPIVSFFGYETDGIFQSEAEVNRHISQASDGNPIQPNAQPGDIRFVDTNNDGIISAADRVAIGSPLPDWTVGSNFSLDYKGFDFSALLTGQLGIDVFNGVTRPDIATSNKQSWILDQWTETNPSNTVPRFVVNDANLNYSRPNDMLHVQDGSFVRIRNVQIGYNLPSSLLEKFLCTSWRWYVAVDNLAVFTSYEGLDPEVGAPEFEGVIDVMGTGIDRGIYPQPRTLRVGTVITF